jgi:hypothetical protein
MTAGVCDKTLHNVQSVKLLINRIKEDIDCWFSAWETGRKPVRVHEKSTMHIVGRPFFVNTVDVIA